MILDIKKIETKLSKTKKAFLDNLSSNEKKEYLLSYLGLTTGYMKSPKRFIPETLYNGPIVYNNFGELLRRYESKLKQKYNAKTDKTPTTKNEEWIGIEIECLLPECNFDKGNEECEGDCFPQDHFNECFQEYLNDNYSASDILEMNERKRNNLEDDYKRDFEYDCDCENGGYIESVIEQLQKSKIPNIQVVSDGSLEDENDYFSCEIKVLTKLSDMSNLIQLCNWLNDNEAKVNTSCGLHIHLDVRKYDNEDRITIVNRFKSSLKFLSKMVPKSRVQGSHANNYCKNEISPINTGNRSDRYYAVNASDFDKHGTIEIRLHSGTVNLTKIAKWCQILSTIKNSDMLDLYAPRKLANFLEAIIKDEELKSYIKERVSKFNPTYFKNEMNEKIEETLDNEETETNEEVA